MSGFYYDIYPSAHMGRSPERPVFSVSDQDQVERAAQARLRFEEAIIIRQFQRMGAWYPEEVRPNLVENGSGDIISMTA